MSVLPRYIVPLLLAVHGGGAAHAASPPPRGAVLRPLLAVQAGTRPILSLALAGDPAPSRAAARGRAIALAGIEPLDDPAGNAMALGAVAAALILLAFAVRTLRTPPP